MYVRETPVAAVATAALLSPVLAHARQTFELANDEVGVAMHYAPGTFACVQVRQEPAYRAGAFGA